MQPKYYKNPYIALLNVELELKAEKDNAEMRISNVEEFQNVGVEFTVPLLVLGLFFFFWLNCLLLYLCSILLGQFLDCRSLTLNGLYCMRS